MKISLVGLSGCGKTSIYATTFAFKKPEETEKFAPTVMYEVRNHPYLGLNVSIFDFGGQEQYRESYLEKTEVFKETDILIPIVDLHDRDSFQEAANYFSRIVEAFKSFEKRPKVVIFYHKYDSKNFEKELLEVNYQEAKKLIGEIFKDCDYTEYKTSIYDQEQLSMIFRDLLVANYKDLQKQVENAQDLLKKIDAKIIISDINGNVIVHNVSGISTGLQLRADLRDFISSCNTLRENFFRSDSVKFAGTTPESNREIHIYIFKYILSVLIMGDNLSDEKFQESVSQLLKDMELFAQLVVKAHEE
ncbi:MAG: ADP-ribosylation factor-like protein [Candidatus Helarchaeota archaeon]